MCQPQDFSERCLDAVLSQCPSSLCSSVHSTYQLLQKDRKTRSSSPRSKILSKDEYFTLYNVLPVEKDDGSHFINNFTNVLKDFIYFYSKCTNAWLCVCVVSQHIRAIPKPARWCRWNPLNCNHRQLWSTMWLLEAAPGSSVKRANAFEHWAISNPWAKFWI